MFKLFIILVLVMSWKKFGLCQHLLDAAPMNVAIVVLVAIAVADMNVELLLCRLDIHRLVVFGRLQKSVVHHFEFFI